MNALKKVTLKTGLFFLEGVLFLSLVIGLFSFSFAGIGQSVTVPTYLEVGNVFPEAVKVFLNGDASINLIANQSVPISCVAVIRDYNGESDLNAAEAVLFDNVDSTFGAADDNNKHYTNSSCNISTDFDSYMGYGDDEYSALANCTFDVWYYANAHVWNCTVTVHDQFYGQDSNSSTQSVNSLLSLLLPSNITYGAVNVTYVSDEQIANVTNVGNVKVNLSLEGYAVTPEDGLAMNCSLGNVQNISIDYEKYNLSESTVGPVTLSEFEAAYLNLTTIATVKNFGLEQRQDDSNQFVDDTNSTYWRVYVPRGVAGNCTGNIIFGATVAPGD